MARVDGTSGTPSVFLSGERSNRLNFWYKRLIVAIIRQCYISSLARNQAAR